jgi:uridylate kinase
MDATSIALAKENSMLVKVVSLYKKDAVINAII